MVSDLSAGRRRGLICRTARFGDRGAPPMSELNRGPHPLAGDAAAGRRRYTSVLGEQALGPSGFVPLPADDEDRAVSALAELIAPLYDRQDEGRGH
jgi:hypothetical protein